MDGLRDSQVPSEGMTTPPCTPDVYGGASEKPFACFKQDEANHMHDICSASCQFSLNCMWGDCSLSHVAVTDSGSHDHAKNVNRCED